MAYEETSRIDTTDTNAPVVVGLFSNAQDAHRAITQLKESGFTSSQIGAAFRNNAAAVNTSDEYTDANRTTATTATSAHAHGHESWWEKIKEAFSPDETATTGIDDANEPVRDTLIPQGSGKPNYDSVSDSDFEGSLSGAGIPSHRASYLKRNLAPGGAIVTVKDAARTQEAEQIITANNGRVRHEDADVAGSAAPGVAVGGNEYSTGRSATSEEGLERVQLFGEVLRVHKDRVQRGEVRLHKDVVTENQSIEVPVTREELVLERVDVTGDRSAPDASIGSSQDIRIPLTEERARLEKRPVVREEMLVGKRQVTENETLADTTRHEELQVDGENVEGKRTGEDTRPDNLRRPA